MTNQNNEELNQKFDAIGRRFHVDVDNFIKDNLKRLTCAHIHDFYFTFWEKLKEFRSTSGGFTGFAELLIFRFIFHALGGEFVPEEVPSMGNESVFIAKQEGLKQFRKKLQDGGHLLIGQELKLANVKIYPRH